MDWADKLNYHTVLSLIHSPSYSFTVTIITKAFFAAFEFTTFAFAAAIVMSFSSLVRKGQLMV